MNEVKIYKGSDVPPPKGKPRVIRPSKSFLWKNYFIFAFIFVIFTITFIIMLFLFEIFIGSYLGESRRNLLYQAFYWLGALYFGMWSIITLFYVIGLYFYIKSMEFIVHGHEIVVKKGLINKSEKHVPYRTVTHIDMRAGPFDRLFNIGTIEIQTAGGKHTLDEQAEEKLEGIKIYREVRDYILTQLRQFQATDGIGAPIMKIAREKKSQIPTAFEDSVPQQMLTELKEIKTLLSTELKEIESKLKEVDEKLEELKKPF
ncbi:MAG: PH domain-containing protein [Candidatus Hodarchaeales archaeon]|jgi:membrane protein YdbS with pleckstrin-like domain